eukprot:14647194-Alexandrium_andersonii.AAC.1
MPQAAQHAISSGGYCCPCFSFIWLVELRRYRGNRLPRRSWSADTAVSARGRASGGGRSCLSWLLRAAQQVRSRLVLPDP